MIIDCNALFGYWQRDTGDRSLARLLRLLARHRIDHALVCSLRGVWDDFREGNEETRQICERCPTLWPVATIRPTDWLCCREEIASLRERGFRMIRFFPQAQGWSVRSLSFQRLVPTLVEAGLPLFFDNGYTSAGLLEPLVEIFAGTSAPLIVSGISYALAEFLAALERHPHIYTDTWQLFLLNEIEIIRDAGGVGHLLFGSRAPFEMIGPSLALIRWARLTEEERAQVLSGNILQLLGQNEADETKPKPAAPSPSSGGEAEAGCHVAAQPKKPRSEPAELPPLASLAYDGPIIDVHAHYGMWPGLPNPYVSLADLVATCRRFRIEHCCLSSTLAINYDLQEGNERLRQALETYAAQQSEKPQEDSGRPQLHGYVVIHPGYREASLADLRRLLSSPFFVGAKLHPKHCGYQANSPEARPLLEYLASQGKPLLAHCWFVEMCEAMGQAADLFPELPMIMGHMGGDDWEAALRVAADRPNLFLELCSGLSPCGKLERAVAIVGAERILFGSDLTLLDPAYTLGFVRDAEIGEQEKRLILYENARRLFGF